MFTVRQAARQVAFALAPRAEVRPRGRSCLSTAGPSRNRKPALDGTMAGGAMPSRIADAGPFDMLPKVSSRPPRFRVLWWAWRIRGRQGQITQHADNWPASPSPALDAVHAEMASSARRCAMRRSLRRRGSGCAKTASPRSRSCCKPSFRPPEGIGQAQQLALALAARSKLLRDYLWARNSSGRSGNTRRGGSTVCSRSSAIRCSTSWRSRNSLMRSPRCWRTACFWRGSIPTLCR
jgi:hypothetical protein